MEFADKIPKPKPIRQDAYQDDFDSPAKRQPQEEKGPGLPPVFPPGYVPHDIVAAAGFESFKTPAQIARDKAAAEGRKQKNPTQASTANPQSVEKSGPYVPFADLGYIPRDIVADAGFESFKTPAQIAREQAVAERRRNSSASTASTTQSPVAAEPSNSGQAQTPQQPPSGFASEGAKVASTGPMRLDSGEVDPNAVPVRKSSPPPLTPEQQLHRKFETDVAARAQSLLKANKDRLDSEQTQYLKDKDPKSARWKDLWQAADQRREFQQKQATAQTNYDYANRKVEELMASPNDFNPMASAAQRRKDAEQKATLIDQYKHIRAVSRSQIEFAQQQQVTLVYTYPALAAIKGETGKNPQDIQKVRERLPETFDGIRTYMSNMDGSLSMDPSVALLFDSVVEQQLQDKSLTPPQRKELTGWLKSTREAKIQGQQLGQLTSAGLFLASFIPAVQGAAIPLRVLGAGLGGGIAASEIPDLMALDTAAQAGKGGAGRFTGQSPEEARLNLVMGYTNVALAGLDVGLEVGAVQKLAGIGGKLATTGVQVSRQQWGQVMGWVKQGPAGVEKAQALLASVKGVSKEKAAETILLIKNGFSPEVETVGVPTGQSAVKTTEENIKDAKALQAKNNAGGSGKAKPPKAFEEYANAAKVKPFIGVKVDPNNLPPGYLHGKIPLGDNKFREVIYMATSDGTKVPLKLDAKGLIKMADEGEYRIVNSGVYTKNIQTIPGKSGKLLGKDSQIHHLIPDNVMREQKIVQEALTRGIYNPDQASNLIEMANKSVSEKTLNALRAKNPNAQLPDIRHYSSHADYDAVVRDVLKQKIKGRDVRQLSDTEIKNVLSDVEKELRGGFLGTNKKIQQRLPINEDNRLVEIPNNLDEEIA
jgi:A nuclease family of the HNH/ENDO VII superfamily with conserved AHH